MSAMDEAHGLEDAGSSPPSHNAQEKEIIIFARRLAANEKSGRDQALARLRVWLTKKPDLSELDLLKIWKGLFYCMWMSDKVPVQQELASSMSKLVSCFGNDVDRLHLFIITYYRTLRREWTGLDKYRLDKYYSFMRLMLREILTLVKSKSWQARWLEKVYMPLEAEVLAQPWPNGLRLHLCDLIVPELETVAGSDITTDAFMTLLAPFFRVLSSCPDRPVFQRALDRVVLDFMTERIKKGQEEYFPHVDLQAMQGRIFDLASATDTKERYRESLYGAHKRIQKVTGVRMVSYKRPREEEGKGGDQVADMEVAAASSPSKAAKKSKDATPAKKQKKQAAAKKQKKGEEEEDEAQPMEVDEKAAAPPSSSPSEGTTKLSKLEQKKLKKKEQEAAVTAAREAQQQQKEAKAAAAAAAAADKKKKKEAVAAATELANKQPVTATEPVKKGKKKGKQEDAMEVEESREQEPAKVTKKQLKEKKGQEAAATKTQEEPKAVAADKGASKKKLKEKVAAGGDKAEEKKPESNGEKKGEAEAVQKPAQFIASSKFAGAKAGYKFQKGKQGVGYYWDKVQTAKTSIVEKGGNNGDKKKVTFGKVHVKVFKRDERAPAGRTISFMPKKQPQQGGKKFGAKKFGGRAKASSYF